MGVTVGSQTCQNALMYDFHGRRTSAGIAHVGFRIVNHHGIGFFQQFHLMFVYVNAVSGDCLLAQHIAVHQAVQNPLAVMLQAMMQILDAFSHMNMVSHFGRFAGSAQFHGFIGNGK